MLCKTGMLFYLGLVYKKNLTHLVIILLAFFPIFDNISKSLLTVYSK